MKRRMKRRCKYFWIFCMVILCLSNAVFLLKHLLDFEIDVHDMGNVMLTIIGFLFAFAAINIYSIFNTNVDEEKGRIVQLTQEYELLLKKDRIQTGLTKDMVRFQMVVHSISATKKMNSQFMEWIKLATDMTQEFIQNLNIIHDTMTKDTFDNFLSDVTMIIRDGRYHMDEKLLELDADSFKGTTDKNVVGIAATDLQCLIKNLEDFENYDFDNKCLFSTDPCEEETIKVCDKMKQVVAQLCESLCEEKLKHT